MGCFGPDAPKKRDYGTEMADTLQAQVDLAPDLYQAEKTYRPGYTELDLQTIDQMLNGVNGQRGMLDIAQSAEPAMSALTARANTASRTADIADIEELGPRATEALLASNPYQRELLDKLNLQANQGLDAGSTVDAETMRNIRNSILGESSGRGWGADPAALAAMGMSTGQAGEDLRTKRQATAMSTLQANQSILGDPFLQILGRPSTATSAAGNMLSQGQAGAANLGPQLFDAESGYAGNLYASNQAYDWQYKQASPSTMGKIGMVSNTIGSFIGSVGKGFMCWVARAVYGAEDGRWLVFRNWLLTEAPVWFREMYRRNGPRWAAWVSRWPWLKRAVKSLMDIVVNARIAERMVTYA